MKVTLCQTPQINTVRPIAQLISHTKEAEQNNCPQMKSVPDLGLTLANYPNVSFGMKPDAIFLLKQCDVLVCAYSGKPMISPFEAKKIYQKLDRRPNALSAINLLQQYIKYMHEVESSAFDLFLGATHKNKRDFHDILQECLPEAQARLKEKQKFVLAKASKLIPKLSEPVAAQVIEIRNTAIERIDEGAFGRKHCINDIKNIKAQGNDAKVLKAIRKILWELPIRSRDIDAFIVRYANESHYNIAKRLISSAVATVEHVKPQSRNGSDGLSNYLLVSACYNSERSSMPLSDYIELYDDLNILENLQNYINTVIKNVNDNKTDFSQKSWYPEEIIKTIATETGNDFGITTDGLALSKKQVKENNSAKKLSKKYRMRNR